MCITQNKSIQEHVNNLALLNKLSALGEKLSQAMHITILTSSLPEEYHLLTSLLESQDLVTRKANPLAPTLTFETAKEAIILEANKQKAIMSNANLPNIANKEKTLIAHPCTSKPDITCNYCKAKGHKEADCHGLAVNNKARTQDHKDKHANCQKYHNYRHKTPLQLA